jgi:curli biogenesis system outer membrane secretion channel CsgG
MEMLLAFTGLLLASPVGGALSEPVPRMAQEAAENTAPQGRPKIAVLPLKGEGTGLFTGQSDDLYQKAASAFFKTKRFDLMERAQLAAVLGEAKFQNAGLVDDASAVDLGKQLGVKFVVLGSYNGAMSSVVESFQGKNGLVRTQYFPAQVSVNLRMVSVETGRIEETFEAVGSSKETSAARGLDAAPYPRR